MKIKRLLTVGMAAALVLSLAGTATAAEPKGAVGSSAPKTDNLENPLGAKQEALRKTGLQKVIKGQATPSGKNQVVKVAKGQYVELARQGEDRIWTLLGEFGDQIHPAYGGDPGPVHNQIPEPDRSVDNSSIWAPDTTPAYYDNMLFSEAPGAVSMRNFYIEQSSNRYTVNGKVEDWVKVPYNEARYGTDACGDIVCTTVWRYVNDVADSFANTSGMSTADLNAYLAQFDVWDRYDYDGDGNFNEPDGFIDHFQTVHAGSGEETGGGAQGADAIWSHRWYAYFPGSFLGPDGDGPHGLGGVRIGNSDYWIGDYTVEPEDGGVGVFSHEFGHDLGLPDLYDTSGNTGGAENSTGFWTLYSSGSYGNSGIPADGIGSKPIPMSAYEKIFLGWSDYRVVGPGQKATVRLGPATNTTKQAQTLVALLPDKHVIFDLGDPASGSYFWYSGAGNNLNSTMTRSFSLPAGSNSFAAKVRYDTELNYDYFYVRVSGDNGATWTTLPTNLSDSGLLGTSGSSSGNWVDWTATIPSQFGGANALIQIAYVTDGGVSKSGVNVDDVNVAGTVDGAETDGTWTLAGGFERTTGQADRAFFNAYFAENRQYTGYDMGLKTGPYNFGFLDDPDLGNWVEHFPYQDGLLVWYYDESFPDNNVGDNCAGGRCGGMYLPVDAHPDLLIRPDNGKVWRPRIQSYDSTFGLEKTDVITLHANSVGQTYGGLPANPKFDDTKDYWVAPNPAIGNFGWSSVPLPKTGTTIRVKSVSSTGFMEVDVNK